MGTPLRCARIYASKARIFGPSGSNLAPRTGFSMHQLIMSRSRTTRPNCDLELGIGLRVRVGRVGMAHVAGNGDRAAQLVGAVEDPRTLRGELLRLPCPGQQVALGEVAVGVALALAALEQVGVVRRRLERVPLFFLRHPLGLRVVAFPLVHQAVGQGLTRKSLGHFDGVAAVASADLDGLLVTFCGGLGRSGSRLLTAGSAAPPT